MAFQFCIGQNLKPFFFPHRDSTHLTASLEFALVPKQVSLISKMVCKAYRPSSLIDSKI